MAHLPGDGGRGRVAQLDVLKGTFRALVRFERSKHFTKPLPRLRPGLFSYPELAVERRHDRPPAFVELTRRCRQPGGGREAAPFLERANCAPASTDQGIQPRKQRGALGGIRPQGMADSPRG
jgi:hypothetical protein